MRGRTLVVDDAPFAWCSSYIQINIYDTNIERLRERGIDIKDMIEHIGCRSIIMNIPIPKEGASSRHLPGEAFGKDHVSIVQTCKRSTLPAKLHNVANESVTAVKVEGTNAKSGHVQSPSSFQEKSNKSLDRTCTDAAVMSDGDEIFQDCIDDDNRIDLLPKHPSVSEISPCKGAAHRGGNPELLQKAGSNHTQMPEAERSFMEYSRKVVDGIHAMNLATRTVADALSSAMGDVVEKAESRVPSIERDLTTSKLLKERTLTSPKKVVRKYRKRPRLLTSDSELVSDAERPVRETDKIGHEKKVLCSNERQPQPSCGDVHEKNFACMYSGCGAKVAWRPHYGKNRLVDHVRIHWGKKVKKCRLCDYVASHQRKVIYHHKSVHKDKSYEGTLSLETKEDMEELLSLWKQCFPGSIKQFMQNCVLLLDGNILFPFLRQSSSSFRKDAALEEFCDAKLGRLHRASSAFYRTRNFARDCPNTKIGFLQSTDFQSVICTSSGAALLRARPIYGHYVN
ncbi:unnamed protein product [Cylicocyclus nassatus]|uniref:C2H2-type domain-containing protein n=1 Tax=Cylicocyclus nassatus TaxID=53992 RepID=A0AA36GH93_CYLNA|nr:unnamed protein product [Cylicocyclus nassatus]